jgi:hypothetical protein
MVINLTMISSWIFFLKKKVTYRTYHMKKIKVEIIIIITSCTKFFQVFSIDIQKHLILFMMTNISRLVHSALKTFLDHAPLPMDSRILKLAYLWKLIYFSLITDSSQFCSIMLINILFNKNWKYFCIFVLYI